MWCNGTSWQDPSIGVVSSCSGLVAGTYDYSSGQYRYCNGTNWISMKGASAGSCAGVTAGTLTYISSDNKLRFCDGTDWFDMVDAFAGGKLVFVTPSTFSGNLGGISGANASCQSAASAAGLSGTFKAWVADGTGSPDTNFNKATTVYYKLNGTTKVAIANNWTDLTDSSLLSAIDRYPNGTSAASAGQVWTNVNPNGTAYSHSCSNWTNSVTSLGGNSSPNTTSTGSSWSSYSGGNATCSELKPLWCFEQ